MIVVLAILIGLLWALKRLQMRMNQNQSGKQLQIIEALGVGPRQKIALIRVGDHKILVGISPGNMTPLGQWPEVSPTSTIMHSTSPASGENHVE
jgi:flagellar protein FliO/FliZ